jgi:hypothetical protein
VPSWPRASLARVSSRTSTRRRSSVGSLHASIINDAPLALPDPSRPGGIWTPSNDDGKFAGPMRLREALVQSKNLVSVRLLDAIGIRYARDYVTRFGFSLDSIPANLSMALGTASVSPMSMARGYRRVRQRRLSGHAVLHQRDRRPQRQAGVSGESGARLPQLPGAPARHQPPGPPPADMIKTPANECRHRQRHGTRCSQQRRWRWRRRVACRRAWRECAPSGARAAGHRRPQRLPAHLADEGRDPPLGTGFAAKC